jgi:hypothetical protein
MNGLRVYINDAIAETVSGQHVFYSRREAGPYYRWVFDGALNEWRVGRIEKTCMTAKDITLATWKKLPVALQRSMGEHYLD